MNGHTADNLAETSSRFVHLSSSWGHSVCDVVKVEFEWTIQHFELRGALESPVILAGEKDVPFDMRWKLYLDDSGIKMCHGHGEVDIEEAIEAVGLYEPVSTLSFSPDKCTKSFWVKTAIVNKNLFVNDLFVKECLIRPGVGMPATVNAISRETLSKELANALVGGCLTIYCEIETTSNDKELTGSGTPFTNQPQSSLSDQFAKDCENLFKNKKFCDVTLNVSGRNFKAHKDILSARSPVFAAMFDHPTKENLSDVVDIHDIEPEVFEEVLRYIYTNRVPSLRMEATAVELLAAADKYLLPKLKQECKHHLTNRMSAENCVKVFSLVENHPASYLKKRAEGFIRRHPTKVMATESWKKAKQERSMWILTIQEMLLEAFISQSKQ